jgi:EAL and modified HD-GYP domain-containing signal transduction protein
LPPTAPDETEPLRDSVHVARQPIVAADGTLHGWELLFRDPHGEPAWTDPDRATAQVLVSAFLEIGPDRLVGDRPAFVNVGDSFLLSRLAQVLPPGGVVLEILEDVRAEPGIVAVAEGLVRAGYRLALDDFTFEPGNDELLRLADYVKIDVLAMPTEDLPRLLGIVRAHGAIAIAEKIETAEMYALCQALGFDLFQGYWLSHPEPQSSRVLSPTRVACMRLLSLLLHEDADLDEIEQILTGDPALTLRVLRMANSASIALRRPVASVRHAVTLVGPATLSSWIVLMLLAAEEEETGASTPPGPTTIAAYDLLVRARMCAVLADHDDPDVRPNAGTSPSAPAFLAGVLSGLTHTLGLTAEELLAQINVTDEVATALTGHSGRVGQALRAVEEYLAHRVEQFGPRLPEVRDAYLDAIGWSESTIARVA